MENFEQNRPLPLELLVEMHKCLPLANAIDVLVNVSSYAFVDINSARMRRNIQRIKMSLNEYIGTMVGEKGKNDREKLMIYKEIEWKPELDALFRYGNWLTSAREFWMVGPNQNIVGVPENFVEELILHSANSSSPQMILQHVRMNFQRDTLPTPTIINQLFNKKEQYWIGDRILFESVQLKTENGQILHIFDGELSPYRLGSCELKLFVQNKMDGKNWFEIRIRLNNSNKFIERLEFSKWNMQSFDDIANFLNENGLWKNDKSKQNGNNKLEVTTNIYWNRNLDIFLRRGAGLTQFRHFKINQQFILYNLPICYIDNLINSIANTKHPEDFLESIEMDLINDRSFSTDKISKICPKDIPKDGKLIIFEGNKLQIISKKTEQFDKKLEFTLANGPTSGAYLFDFEVQFKKQRSRSTEIVKGIKIQKRKNDGDFVEMKCKNQIELGKKRKATNYEDGEEEGPTCSAKIMKK